MLRLCVCVVLCFLPVLVRASCQSNTFDTATICADGSSSTYALAHTNGGAGTFSLYSVAPSTAENDASLTALVSVTGWGSQSGVSGWSSSSNGASTPLPFVLVNTGASLSASTFSLSPPFGNAQVWVHPGTSDLLIKYTPPSGVCGTSGCTLTATTVQDAQVGCSGANTGFKFALYSCPSSGSCSNSPVAGGSGSYTEVDTSGSTSASPSPIVFSDGDLVYFRMTLPNSAGTPDCNGGYLDMTVSKGLTALGDPSFTGFRGQKFVFSGVAGSIYHIFSDSALTINALFGSATKTSGGTVMKALELRFENHTLRMSRDDPLNRPDAVNVVFDGKNVLVARAAQRLGNCAAVVFSGRNLLFKSPAHSFKFYYDSAASSHINTTFLDINFDFSMGDIDENASGLLGQTTKEGAKISLDEDLFVVPLGGKAKTEVFKGDPIC